MSHAEFKTTFILKACNNYIRDCDDGKTPMPMEDVDKIKKLRVLAHFTTGMVINISSDDAYILRSYLNGC